MPRAAWAFEVPQLFGLLMSLRAWGLRFCAWGLGFRPRGPGLRVLGLRIRVLGSGFRVCGLRVWRLGLWGIPKSIRAFGTPKTL